ncbi:MAG: ABC transporter substrate-binding protein [Micromonosporaceae bacterium]
MLRLLLPLVLVATLAACGGSEAGTDGIRLQVSGEPEETAVYQAMVNAYTKKYPDRKVELVRVASKGDHLARLSSAFAAGNPPDTFLINFREYAQFVARGALRPVEPGLKLDLDAYFPQPVEAFTYRGALQCMPQNISSLVVYYNPAVFKRRGVPVPAAGWGWKEFAETARRLAGGGVHGLGVEPKLIRLAPFVWANGGEIVDDPAKPTRLTLDTPAARGAIEFLAGLIRDPAVVPDLTAQKAQDLETRFAAGTLGMYLGSRRDTPKFREVSGLDFAVAPLPAGKRQATLLHSDAYCLARGSAHTEEALDFIRYAVGEQGQRLTALSGRTVPSLKAVADSPVFLAPGKPPAGSQQAFLDTVPVIRRTPVLPTWPEIEDVADEELTQLFYAPTFDPDAALAELDRRTRPLFR